MSHLGAAMTRVEPGLVEIEMAFSDELSQQHGFYHAGGIASVIDTAGGYAAATLFAPDDGVLTVEFKLNLMSPADGEMLIARGEVIKPGRTLTVTKGEVFVRKDGETKLCALMQQTLMRIVGRTGIQG
ncbi:MAG: PaaI family thioesterase [Rhodospirillales bacterium]|nr:PaaI family thioesterase [Rhodospirillales bacterium]